MKEKHLGRNLLFAGGILIFGHGVYEEARIGGNIAQDKKEAEVRHPFGTQQFVLEADTRVEEARDSLIEQLEAQDFQALVHSERKKYLRIVNRRDPSEEKRLLTQGEIFGPPAVAAIYFSGRKKLPPFPRRLK